MSPRRIAIADFCRPSALALTVGLSLATKWSAARSDDATLLTQAFSLTSSAQSQYAQHLRQQTFYEQLYVENLRTDLKGNTCVDTGFMTWLRKFFKKDTKRITLVANVTSPGEIKGTDIPLFEVSKDEKADPQQCLTDVVSQKPITPLFVATPVSDFQLTVRALTQQSVNMSVASTTVAMASDLLSMTGGSAWLLQNIAKNQAIVNAAVSKIDSSLSQNWSATDQKNYHFNLNAWPSNGDWAHHLDGAEFSVGSLIANKGGIKVDPNLVPTLRIELRYRVSVFGEGRGQYVDEDQILATKLATSNGDTLADVFALGLPGFTTANAMAITSAEQMTSFCQNMRTNFSNFLTSDDHLAARHAVLLRRTNFYNLPVLRNAQQCMSGENIATLKQLNPDFELPDIRRRDAVNRKDFIEARGKHLLSPAFSSATDQSYTAVLAAPERFSFAVSQDVLNVFPPAGSSAWGSTTGAAAVQQLVTAGAFRTGCWNALPQQNLKNIIGIALNRKTGNSSAILVEFDADYPGPASTATDDKGKVKRITFLSVEDVQALTSVPNWPDDNCTLI